MIPALNAWFTKLVAKVYDRFIPGSGTFINQSDAAHQAMVPGSGTFANFR